MKICMYGMPIINERVRGAKKPRRRYLRNHWPGIPMGRCCPRRLVFSDKNAATGINYYRLKMIDNDGAFKYSNMLTFTSGAITGVQMVVAPNPTVDMINV
jgi:hypothetical protein